MHEGHRQRMFKRVLSNREGLCDHELLEILLYGIIARKNTNLIAHNLIAAFGSLNGVFNATYEQLIGVEEIGEGAASYLLSIGEIINRVKTKREQIPSVCNLQSLTEFVGARLSRCTTECIELYCIDTRERIKFVKRFEGGDSTRLRVAPEEVSRAIITQNPTGIILAHNHPGCTSKPSAADDRFTAQIYILCSMNNIRLHDHVILGSDGIYSYFKEGKLDVIKDQYSVNKILKDDDES